jgi:hypothetical protein
MKLNRILILVAAMAATAACGDDNQGSSTSSGGSSNNNNNNNNGSPSTASEEINAAEGGEVSLDDGAGLVIPAGALDDDTEITIESAEPASSLPDQDSLQGLTYELGPDGTTFSKPVELTLPLDATPGADQEAVISWYNEDTEAWEDVTSTVSNGEVTAEIEHFTLFVVRFVGVEEGEVDCAFEACSGGDIVGTWEIQGACVDLPVNPLEETCPEATIDLATNMSGTVSFNDDGTYDVAITLSSNFSFTLPASCVTEGVDCQADLGDDETTCESDGAGGCSCTQTGSEETQENSGTYEVSGSTITTTQDGETNTVEICVSGNTLKVMDEPSSDADGGAGSSPTIIWQAKRQ